MTRSAVNVTRLPGSRRGVAVCAMALASATAVLAVLAVPARAAASVPASQPLVVLLHNHVARTHPEEWAHRIETVPGRRPLTHVPTVLPVIGRTTAPDGRSWTRVRLPGRPSGHTGWITTSRTRPAKTAWQLSLDLSARRVTVYQDGLAVRRLPAIVGAPATPTPRGRFFIEEALKLSPTAAGGPFALATSARSAVLQEFEGGPGQIALHGTNGLSGALGTAASHGCIRLRTEAITWLSRRIGAGVPLTVKG
jgi:lipoprotein-anchoring transpeptidase ErfK/SrfK